MSDISTLLKDASEQAQNYADGTRAVSRAQRVRRTRAAVAAMVVLGLLASGMWLVRQRQPDVPANPPARSHPLYPPVVTPSGETPPIPAGPLAAASFLYSSCLDKTLCAEYLVLPDGTQYRLPAFRHSLSPDGIYLGWAVGEHYRVRDLRSGTVVDVGVPGKGRMVAPLGWSPNGRHVVIVRWDDTEPRTYIRAAADGSAAPVTIPHDDTPTDHRDEFLGVLDSGEIVALPGGQYPHPDHLSVLDALSGKGTRTITLDKAGIASAAGVTPGGVEISLAPCGCEVDFLLGHPMVEFAANTGIPQVDRSVVPASSVVHTGVVRANATGSGRVLGRVDLPNPVLDKARARFSAAWSIRADLPEGYIAVNWRLDGTDIVIVDRVTGARNVVTRLPAGAVILLRGNVHSN